MMMSVPDQTKNYSASNTVWKLANDRIGAGWNGDATIDSTSYSPPQLRRKESIGGSNKVKSHSLLGWNEEFDINVSNHKMNRMSSLKSPIKIRKVHDPMTCWKEDDVVDINVSCHKMTKLNSSKSFSMIDVTKKTNRIDQGDVRKTKSSSMYHKKTTLKDEDCIYQILELISSNAKDKKKKNGIKAPMPEKIAIKGQTNGDSNNGSNSIRDDSSSLSVSVSTIGTTTQPSSSSVVIMTEADQSSIVTKILSSLLTDEEDDAEEEEDDDDDNIINKVEHDDDDCSTSSNRSYSLSSDNVLTNISSHKMMPSRTLALRTQLLQEVKLTCYEKQQQQSHDDTNSTNETDISAPRMVRSRLLNSKSPFGFVVPFQQAIAMTTMKTPTPTRRKPSSTTTTKQSKRRNSSSTRGGKRDDLK